MNNAHYLDVVLYLPLTVVILLIEIVINNIKLFFIMIKMSNHTFIY